MHELMLKFFEFLRSFLQFMKIVCMFLIILLLLYWIQNLTNAQWGWIAFLAPFFDFLLDFANSICSLSFDIFGTVFELKYLSAVIILTISFFVMNLLRYLVSFAEGVYKSAHFVCKKTGEAVFNAKLQMDASRNDKKIKDYTIAIKTQLSKKAVVQSLNLAEQNKLMNDFIFEKTGVKPKEVIPTNLYCFNQYDFYGFENIDEVIEIMFRVVKTKAPIDVSVCIQAGENNEQLGKLMSLNNFRKITMAADTAYRYGMNKVQNYDISPLGVFQNGENTIELHEFVERI